MTVSIGGLFSFGADVLRKRHQSRHHDCAIKVVTISKILAPYFSYLKPLGGKHEKRSPENAATKPSRGFVSPWRRSYSLSIL